MAKAATLNASVQLETANTIYRSVVAVRETADRVTDDLNAAMEKATQGLRECVDAFTAASKAGTDELADARPERLAVIPAWVSQRLGNIVTALSGLHRAHEGRVPAAGGARHDGAGRRARGARVLPGDRRERPPRAGRSGRSAGRWGPVPLPADRVSGLR
jgi:hypothetical protein